MAKKKKPKKKSFLISVVEKIEDFIDWVAPVAEWVGDKADQIKAASDAVPPPSRKWVKNRRIDTRNATVSLFLLFLTVVTVVAMYLPNRPSYSELEQRSLTKFPKPTFVEVLDGTFFNDINTWFADTFPYREKFLAVHGTLEGFYGFRGQSISGDVVEGDEIPDAEQVPQKPIPVIPEQQPDTSEQEQSTSSAEGQTPSQTEAKPPKEEEPDDTEDFSKAETLGALYVNGGTAYEYYNFVREHADHYISMVNRAAEQLDGKAKVYDMIVPTSMHICIPEKVWKKRNTSDQAKAIDYFYQSMSQKVTTVNVMDTLLEHQAQKEYLYFRTDHHWTALGAYYAYQRFAPAAGRKTASLSSFTEMVSPGFLGSFYRQLNQNKDMAKKPDVVYGYAPKSVSTMNILTREGQEIECGIVRNGDKLPEGQKYLSFIGGDNPWSEIHNPKLQDGSSILLIKESFGNCFAPYLAESYENVYIVDYRYFSEVDSRTLVQLVEDYGIKDVLFLNNISATREENLINLMDKLVG